MEKNSRSQTELSEQAGQAGQAEEAWSTLLHLPMRILRSFTQNVYDLSETGVVRLLAEAEPLREAHEASIVPQSEAHAEYRAMAHVLWRSYRQADAAKPMLEKLIALDPADADSHFWLAQIHQESLGDPFAITHYQAFLDSRNAAEGSNVVGGVVDPPNNHFIDSSFRAFHGFNPSMLEALTNIGLLHRDVLHDRERAREYFNRAIALAPNHHLAPYVMLADMLPATEAHDLYKKAIDAFFGTEWEERSEIDDQHSNFPSLIAWAPKRYPFASRWWRGVFEHTNRVVALVKTESTTTTTMTTRPCIESCMESLARICKEINALNSMHRESRIILETCERAQAVARSQLSDL